MLLPPAAQPATVYEIIADSPDHTILETALLAAGLDDDLQTAGPFTVFAPTDAAFAGLAPGVLDNLIANPAQLAEILLYHVVGSQAASTDLSNGQTIETLQGEDVEITIAGGVQVNDANVIVADLFADNGVVHVIDGVLLPPVSVSENTNSAFTLFPNPAVDFITLNGEFAAASMVRIIDQSGRIVFETTLNGINRFDISALASGVYNLVVSTDNTMSSQTFVKR